MCGIIGYIGNRKASKILIEGLKRLEYRGYDSSGVAISDCNGIRIVKKKGKVDDISDEALKIEGNLGIGHTRWATHGEPNESNAHPHSSEDNSIAIVHNGIIENYHELKHEFDMKTDTDSEIIAFLISKYYDGNLLDALRKTLDVIEGTYAIAAIHEKDEEIVFARRGSPLLIGIGEHEMYLGSDATAIGTDKIIYLNDDEYGKITKDSFEVYNSFGERANKDIVEIDISKESIDKKGYPCYMLKEIFEQPKVIEDIISRWKNINIDSDRIMITACGTSWHAALIGKHYIEKLARVPVEVDYASEFRYRDPIVNEGDLVIVISQSGETADTLAALREAKKRGARTMGLVNVKGSTIAREVDDVIFLNAGPEIGVASTKAFLAQLMVLLMAARDMGAEKNAPLSIIPDKIEEVLKQNDYIRPLAKKFIYTKNMLYLGRGLLHPIALEGALKLKEISYIHAEGYPAAEMKHGPIALIDENMPVVFLAPKDDTHDKIISNMEEIKARKGKIITITDSDDEKIKRLSDYIISMPSIDNILTPLIYTIPLQLLAYHIADLKNIDVDKPRNLAKSVTVE